jgi:phosphoribosylformylglycinamidine cyclo-ligase
MPDVYPPGEFDLAGFVVGVMDRASVGANGVVAAGDIVIGLPSTGLHTNGYSLARRALPPATWRDFDPELNATVGEALLSPHRSYVAEIQKLFGVGARSFAHITGGGLPDNVARIVPRNLTAEIDTTTWAPPAIFNRIAREGSVLPGEMYRVFNMGIGLVGIVPPQRVEEAIGIVPETIVIGEVVPRGDDAAVRLLGLAA